MLLLLTIEYSASAGSLDEMAIISSGNFQSVIPEGKEGKLVKVDTYLLDRRPVTNREFLDFTNANPQWRRNDAVGLFVDKSYLSHWQSAVELGPDVTEEQPVIHVSWFSATAYCEARGARLPGWYEWEYAAAANETLPDARDDSSWRQKILNWYSTPSNSPLAPVGQRPANYYGVHDLHGLVWEWVDDYNALLVAADNREQGGADRIIFCGAGAISMERKEDYAVLMRVAMLSSLEASYTTRNLGFRCAAEILEHGQ